MLKPLSEVPEGELFKIDNVWFIKGVNINGKHICFSPFREKNFPPHAQVDHAVGEKDFRESTKIKCNDWSDGRTVKKVSLKQLIPDFIV